MKKTIELSEDYMKDIEWRKRIEAAITEIKELVKTLGDGKKISWQRQANPATIELDIEWPEADIGGLHFNPQKTRGVFELKGDGNYYSRDILIHSARDTDDGTGRDLLSEYLDSEAVKDLFYSALTDANMGVFSSHEIYDCLRVFIPEGNQGIKKYNGVRWWYWLKSRAPSYAAAASSFCHVSLFGSTFSYYAGSVGGCAPAFCVANDRGADVS
jgi:hypothetical protein